MLKKPSVNWDYNISARALRQLKKLDPQTMRRIMAFLQDRITGSEDPRQWGSQLKGPLKNLWRYRCGDYRILCQLQDNVFIVLVLEIGPRKSIYRK